MRCVRIRSATACDVYRTTAFKSCVASTTALPARASAAQRSRIRMACSTSRLAVGSSSRMNSGCTARLRAITTRWRSPPESVLTARLRNSATPHHSIASSIAWRSADGRALESPAMRIPAHGDDLSHRERKIQPVVLRHEGNPLRDGTPSQRAERLSVERDRAVRDRPDSGQRAQQRTLPAAVGTRDGHNYAGFHSQIHAIENSAAAASDSRLRELRASS